MSSEILLREEKSEPFETEVVLSKPMALKKFDDATALLEKHRPPNPSFVRFLSGHKHYADVKTYPLIKTWNDSFGFDNHAYPVRWVKGFAIGFVSTGFVASTIWSSMAGVSLLSLLPFAVGAVTSTVFDVKLYDGSAKNPLRLLVCKLFLSKKSKQKVKRYRENVLSYQKVEKSFKLLVESVKTDLFNEGVFDLLSDSESTGNEKWCIDDLGHKVLLPLREFEDMCFEYTNNEKNHEEIIQQLISRSDKFKELSEQS